MFRYVGSEGSKFWVISGVISWKKSCTSKLGLWLFQRSGFRAILIVELQFIIETRYAKVTTETGEITLVKWPQHMGILASKKYCNYFFAGIWLSCVSKKVSFLSETCPKMFFVEKIGLEILVRNFFLWKQKFEKLAWSSYTKLVVVG